jgi:hypothetical protein
MLQSPQNLGMSPFTRIHGSVPPESIYPCRIQGSLPISHGFLPQQYRGISFLQNPGSPSSRTEFSFPYNNTGFFHPDAQRLHSHQHTEFSPTRVQGCSLPPERRISPISRTLVSFPQQCRAQPRHNLGSVSPTRIQRFLPPKSMVPSHQHTCLVCIEVHHMSEVGR